jgi:hypothetical protein
VITELRRYRIKPGHLDSWLALFAEAARENARHGIRVDYAGVDRETGTLVWLRTFADEEDRVRRKDAFYGSAWWLEREAFAMAHILEYDVTFLDAVIVQEGGTLADCRWPAPGDPAGSTPDAPPNGWVRSPRAKFVRKAPGPEDAAYRSGAGSD